MKNFLQNLRIQTKLFLGFFIIVVIMIVAGIRELVLLSKLQSERANISKIVNLVYTLKEGRTFVNHELQILNNLEKAKTDPEAEKVLTEHYINKVELSNLYDEIKTNSNYRKGTYYSDERLQIRDSISMIQKLYKEKLDPVFLKVFEFKKNILNIDLFYGEYLKIREEKNDKNIRIETKDGLQQMQQDEMEGAIKYLKQLITKMNRKIKYAEDKHEKIATQISVELQNTYSDESTRTVVFIVIAFFASLFISFFISRLILRPIEKINVQVEKLTEGKLPSDIYTAGRDEIGEMGRSLKKLVSGLEAMYNFSTEIGKGNFDVDFRPVSKEDVLGNALVDMRNGLQKAREEDIKRQKEDFQNNRAAEGIALFGDILRRYSEDTTALSNEVISALVEFTNSKQGAVFIINDEDENNVYLDLAGAYAYNRRKYLKRKVEPGVGLIGAVFVEKYSMYLTEVPNDFLEIESGFGGENPKSLLIVPLKVEEEVLGVIELASFNEFEQYEIELIEGIASNIAASLASTRINMRTATLLKESNAQKQQMDEQKNQMLAQIGELKTEQEKRDAKIQELQDEISNISKQNQKLKKSNEEQLQELQELEVSAKQEKNKNKINNFLYEVLLQKSPVGVITLNKKMVINEFNVEAEKIWGYQELDVKDQNFKMLLDEQKHAKIIEAKHITQVYEELNNKELFIKKNTKDVIPTICNISKFNTQTETIYVLLIQDISKQKSQEAQITALNESYLTEKLEAALHVERLEEILNSKNIPYPTEIVFNELIPFKPQFNLGIEIIDKQHKKWIELVNTLYIILKNKESDSEKIITATNELYDYLDYHFSFEEKYMKEFNFDYIGKHRKYHQAFMRQLDEYRNLPANRLVLEGIMLMSKWKRTVVAHILIEDKKYESLFKNNGLI